MSRDHKEFLEMMVEVLRKSLYNTLKIKAQQMHQLVDGQLQCLLMKKVITCGCVLELNTLIVLIMCIPLQYVTKAGKLIKKYIPNTNN